MRRVFVSGSAGFIGFHLARELLDHGFAVFGYDGMTDYYDVASKRARHATLQASSNHFHATEGMLENMDALAAAYENAAPDVVVHLAAQAGVRHSLEHPRSYIEANVVGTFNLMELTRRQQERARGGDGAALQHFLFASTSSVYGANTDMPFTEDQRCDTPLTIYAATKKATEGLTHAYAHLHDVPTTGFRFFTVYGPEMRPDLALLKFADAIEDGRAIDIYNHGEMVRDFTYVGDIVRAIRLLVDAAPPAPDERDGDIHPSDTLSPVAPHRIVNIGAGKPVRLLDFVDRIEAELGLKAKRNYMDMQTGDVPATHASIDLLRSLTGFAPQTDLDEGVRHFVRWYRARAKT